MRHKQIGINVLKIAVAAGLISWLILSGRLDPGQLRELILSPDLLLAVVGYWLTGACILASVRWYLLLRGAGYQIRWSEVLRLQLIGYLFNLAMPGAVGGDLVKVIYVIRQNKDQGKAPAFMSILLDRVIGLSGLFFIGMIVALVAFGTLMEEPLLRPMLISLFSLNLGIMIFFAAALWHYRGEDPILRLPGAGLPAFRGLRKVYESVRIYRYRRGTILACFGLSLGNQLLGFSLFYFITIHLNQDGSGVPLAGLMTIFPIGMLSAAVPIAPGGLGVGHVAFDQLYGLIGLTGGANVFNLFTLSMLTLSTVGIIPYLRMKQTQPGALAPVSE